MRSLKTCVRGGLLGLALALAVLARPALAANANDIFTVKDVPVDATAANAAAARDEARADGERKAYALLMGRLTPAADHDRLPPPNQALLNDLIGGFEVAKERTSGVRYLANLTYHFRPNAVRGLLRRAGIPFADTPSKPLVVLPVLEGGASPVLWEDPNPWRDAWGTHLPPRGLVPFVLPDGDLEDIQAIDAPAAVSGDAQHLQAVAQRYGDVDVLVARATLDGSVSPHTLAVTSTRYTIGADLPPQSWNRTYTAAAGESDGDLMADGVAGTGAVAEDAWKQANILDYGRSGTITVRVPIGDLKGWVMVRDRLKAVPAIEKSQLVSIDRSEARVSIEFHGDPAQLRTALAQRDLQLEGDDPNYVLEERATSAQQ